MDNNNNERNLIKYSITLLIVAIICIAIGGISMSRSINRGDGRVMRNFNANDKVKEISSQNLTLTQENLKLQNEIEVLNIQKEEISKEKETVQKEKTAYEIYFEALKIKTTDEEKYETLINSIKEMDINEELKKKLTEEE